MGTILIKIDAQSEDGSRGVRCELEWQGGREDILKLLRHVDAVVARADVPLSAKEFAMGVVLDLPATGVFKEGAAAEVQQMMIIYAALQLVDEEVADLPRSIVDTVAVQDITVALTIRGMKLNAKLFGRPPLDS
jgi:hypothetical protein